MSFFFQFFPKTSKNNENIYKNSRFDSFYFFSTIFLGPGIGLNGFRLRFDYIKTRAGGVEREMFSQNTFSKISKKINTIFELTFVFNFFLKSSLFYFLAPRLQRPRSTPPARVFIGLKSIT